ncbi:hypothetical protein [Campylobacter sp. LR291e]|uniref:hypothetical protein n=1 Tax=Campylobacter sp. LR291e TaxID=2593546 RepID=UPI001CC1F95A|nr:hypothetical protein [Campylobacter sp. LR291e]
MSEEEIEKIYRLISEKYESNLKKFGVKKINLKDKNGNYTKDALVLIYLARDYPKTQAISKQELTEFVRKFYPNVSDVQQARHLAKQKGYNIISGTRGDINEKIAPASYKLLNLEYPYPSFKQDRRSGINAKDFEDLKKQYNYRCATCGSIENQPHNIRNNEITKLQAGHMNPSKPLVFGISFRNVKFAIVPIEIDLSMIKREER